MPNNAYEIVDLERAKTATNADEFVWEGPWGDDFSNYLLDTRTNEIVFSDSMEPEDATLSRDLSPLVTLLNEEGNRAR